jgi:hypothetical protein
MGIGFLVSVCVGVWHFFVPYAFKWYSYIPGAPRQITVSIDWINFFFSLFLSGISLLLFLFRHEIAKRNRVAVAFYGFLTFVWACRVAITLIHPWSYDTILIAQSGAFLFVFLLLAIPFARLVFQKPEGRAIGSG